MSSIDFINYSVLKLTILSCAAPVVPIVVVPVTTSVVTVGMFGARDAPMVKGTIVETTGITLGG